MEEAFHTGGTASIAVGFLAGGLVYTLANVALGKWGARHRTRSGHQEGERQRSEDSGLALALGALLDGIPECIVIGLSLLKGGAVSFVAVVAIFLSNIPESLSSASGMRHAGRSARYVLGIWGSIVLISGLASLAGYTIFRHFSADVVAGTTAVAAGGILAMLADTMIPEAFEEAHDWAGLITVLGFLTAFLLSKMG